MLGYYYGYVCFRGDKFKVLNKPVPMAKEEFSKIASRTEKESILLEPTFDGKQYKLEVMPHKDSFRLVKVNGIDGK